MKVFGICGSPRNDTTYHVLKEALDKLNNHGFETELFSCFGKDKGFCNIGFTRFHFFRIGLMSFILGI